MIIFASQHLLINNVMYRYNHKRLSREDFEYVFKTYKIENDYQMFDWEPAHEWRYYERNRSWMAASIDHWLVQEEYYQPLWFKKISNKIKRL